MRKLIVALFVIGAAPGARASEYGRKVLLCRASPASNGGPKGVPDCVPPIDQVYHELSRVKDALHYTVSDACAPCRRWRSILSGLVRQRQR